MLFNPSIFFLRSSCFRVNLQWYKSQTTDKRKRYNWMAGKKMAGLIAASTAFETNERKVRRPFYSPHICLLSVCPFFCLLLWLRMRHIYTWTRPNFSQPSIRIALIYQSFFSRTKADRLLHDWIAEINLVDSMILLLSSQNHSMTLPYSTQKISAIQSYF